METGIVSQQPFLVMITLALLSLLPFAVLLCTSFIKFSAVLSILRSALATPQIPPNTVITGLSLILSILVMFPVLSDIGANMKSQDLNLDNFTKTSSLDQNIQILAHCIKEPVEGFLRKHTHESELRMLEDMFQREEISTGSNQGFLVLTTAFVLSELKEAFQIGFLIFLPFIVIDLLIANILQAMGMVMLSPTTISLPFKLLMFVMADGWYLLIESLVTSYLM